MAAVAFSLQMAFLGNLTKDCDSVHIAIVENLSTLAVMTVILMFTGWDMPASDIACLRKLFLRRGILHRALFCAAKHRTAKHCAEQGGNHHYNGIYFCGGIFCDFIRRTDALQGISGVCGDFCGNGFGGKACAGEKIAVDKANKIE